MRRSTAPITRRTIPTARELFMTPSAGHHARTVPLLLATLARREGEEAGQDRGAATREVEVRPVGVAARDEVLRPVDDGVAALEPQPEERAAERDQDDPHRALHHSSSTSPASSGTSSPALLPEPSPRNRSSFFRSPRRERPR